MRPTDAPDRPRAGTGTVYHLRDFQRPQLAPVWHVEKADVIVLPVIRVERGPAPRRRKR